MNKTYIICHMMISIDGRIDCVMSSQLKGVSEYYSILEDIDVPSTVSGRITAELEKAQPGEFVVADNEKYGKEGFSKKADTNGYEIVVDTHGRLLWPDAAGMDKPYLIITSENVTKDYFYCRCLTVTSDN